MLVITHEGRFLGCDNVVFAFRDTHVVRTMRRHLHNKDPRTFVRRDASRVDQYNLVRPVVPMAPLDFSKVRVESRGLGFMWRLIAAGCEMFVVIELDEDEGGGALAMRGVHAELPGRGDMALTVKNLTSLFEHGKGVFCEDA
jgi:hypothetical protein